MFNCSNPVQALIKKSQNAPTEPLRIMPMDSPFSEALPLSPPSMGTPLMPAPAPMPMPAPGSPTNLLPPATNPLNPPSVLPEAPTFRVPANPLLPPGYQEVLDYDSIQYLNGFARTQIGKFVQIDFLVGSTSLTTRSGRLVGVGINYILLQDLQTNDIIACDFYNIKFIRFYGQEEFMMRMNGASS